MGATLTGATGRLCKVQIATLGPAEEGEAVKLSDAMREADRLGIPDLRGRYIETIVSKWGGEVPPACAIGGAAIAAGIKYEFIETIGGTPLALTDATVDQSMQPAVDDVDRLDFPRDRRCPVCYQECQAIREVIICLYDSHEWSRTRIADWLDKRRGKVKP